MLPPIGGCAAKCVAMVYPQRCIRLIRGCCAGSAFYPASLSVRSFLCLFCFPAGDSGPSSQSGGTAKAEGCATAAAVVDSSGVAGSRSRQARAKCEGSCSATASRPVSYLQLLAGSYGECQADTWHHSVQTRQACVPLPCKVSVNVLLTVGTSLCLHSLHDKSWHALFGVR